MEFDGVENLSEEQILDLYNDVIEDPLLADTCSNWYTTCSSGQLWQYMKCRTVPCYSTNPAACGYDAAKVIGTCK